MFNRENAFGILLLGICAVSAGIMLYYIGVGTRPTISLGPIGNAVGLIIFVGLLVLGFLRTSLGRRLTGQGDEDQPSGPQWPDPATGRRSLWDRLRGK